LITFDGSPGVVRRGLAGAYSSGIKVSNIKLMSFILASFFIALASICLLLSTAIGDPRSGLSYTLNSVAAVVI